MLFVAMPYVVSVLGSSLVSELVASHSYLVGRMWLFVWLWDEVIVIRRQKRGEGSECGN